MRIVQTFESFTNDNVPAMIDEFDSEISSSKMRVGPSMDKLPWAMEVVVFEFLKDKAMEANSSSGSVDIDSIVGALEDAASDIKQKAIDQLINAGMGEDEVKGTYDIGYKVVKLKNYNLTARPIEGKRGIQSEIEENTADTDLESTVNPDESEQDKEFRSARNRGRNIMRKHLDSANYRKPAPKKKSHKGEITVKKIEPTQDGLV